MVHKKEERQAEGDIPTVFTMHGPNGKTNNADGCTMLGEADDQRSLSTLEMVYSVDSDEDGRKYSLETLPKPDDERVRFRVVEPHYVAARRYSGRWTESKYLENELAILEALERDGLETTGTPTFARYNAPFTPWFMRRNEVLIVVDWPAP